MQIAIIYLHKDINNKIEFITFVCYDSYYKQQQNKGGGNRYV